MDNMVAPESIEFLLDLLIKGPGFVVLHGKWVSGKGGMRGKWENENAKGPDMVTL